MMFRPPKSFFSTSSKDFLSEIDPLIILPKNVTGLEWMEGMKDVKSDGSVVDETEKGVVFIDDNYASRFVSFKSKAYPI